MRVPHLGLLLLTLLLPLLLASGPTLRVSRAEEPDADDEAPLDDSADGEVPFGEQVNRAIDRGVKWLLAKPTIVGTGDFEMAQFGLVRGAQLYGGGEGSGYGHPAGCTALALYTLLKCGVSSEHPVVEKAFNWLQREHTLSEKYDGVSGSAVGFRMSYREARGSYELAAETLALTAKYDQYKRTKNTKLRRKRGKLQIRDKEDRAWLQSLVHALVERRGLPHPSAAPGERRGWRYNLKEVKLTRGRQGVTMGSGGAPPHANQDLSSTQLAALALFSAHQFSARVSEDVWADIVLFTLQHQEDSGPEHERHSPGYRGGAEPPVDRARGFMYIKGSPDDHEGKATGGMTACGIANLLMAKDVLLESTKGRKRWKEHGFEQTVDKAIWDGLAWLDRNWSAFANPVKNSYHTYYLYAVERAMDLMGKQLVGKHVWYNEGAMAILSRQMPVKVKDPLDPRAPEVDAVHWNTGTTHKPYDVLDTCFCLLFLKRATKDIVPGVPVTEGDHGAPVDNR